MRKKVLITVKTYPTFSGKYEELVCTSMGALIEEAKNLAISTSLAVFKPTKIRDFIWEEEEEKEWDKDKLTILQQGNLFEEKGSDFKVVRKPPFKFKYVFESDSGSVHNLMIEDWEVGALFWKGLEKTQDNVKACEYVRAKYFDDFTRKHDLHFFLGTTKLWHKRALNPFIIIGAFYPMIEHQTSLF